MCTNCEPILGGASVTISQPQQPFCQDCGSDAHCIEKMDAACVVYHLANPQKVSKLGNLGLGNGATVEQALEAITDLVGNQFNIPLTVNDTASVNLTASGASGHTLKADLLISSAPGNLLELKSDGVFVTDTRDGKVKVTAQDASDYLINQVVGGTDGCVSNSVTAQSGLLHIQPTLDLTCLIGLLAGSSAFEELICGIVAKCLARCPEVDSADISTISE